jgi:hypothetical protein
LATAAFVVPASADELARLEWRVRDSQTGAGVPVQLSSPPVDGKSAVVLGQAAVGRGMQVLPPGRHVLRVEGQGYRPLETWFDLSPGRVLPVTIWLDPLDTPDSSRAARPVRGMALVEGHCFDASTGLPLAGARVRLASSASQAVSGADGALALEVAARTVDETSALPVTDDLLATADGYRTLLRRGLFLVDGVTRLILDLEPGAGTAEVGERHKMQRPPEELREPQPPAPSVQLPSEPAARGGAALVAVPATIRVGTSCTCATCSAVQVFSLDTYTRLGLNDEWIASWRPDSLRAGAIAYRSYGAYHVFHPRNANYDICNTTCCQVLDATDSHANTDAATAFTSGMIVVNAAGTEPFFAEYAAENNGNFCPDGQTGRPANSWPCLADAVDAGTTFNGHGRGMCQWGTQRWAANQGRDYLWIVNHYYNDNGNPSGARSGVLQPPASDFFTLAPCRVVDTRESGQPLAANSTRTFVLGGPCQVPTDARAVAAILTVANPGDVGNLRVYATGQPAPLASAINFVPALTRANNAILPLGSGGQIDVQCDMPPGSLGSTHLVLDVFGYFR